MTGISRRDDATYLAIDPETFQLSKRVMIRHKRLQYVAQQSLGASLEVDYLVKETLEKPLHVYQGLRFDRDEDKFEGQGWRCYCSAPEYRFKENGEQANARYGFVYLVFVNSDSIAYNWRWEEGDANDNRQPTDFLNRFSKKLF
jgi:hypothetical protein